MTKTQTPLYWKISATLLGLLIILGIAYILITAFIGRNYFQEANQRLYGGIADSTVQLVRPLVDGKVDTLAVQDIMHSMMVINPSVEVYLLDTTGNIITFVAPNKRVKLDRVDLDPIRQFIGSGKEKPFIKGDDPRNPGTQKVFSAAPIREDDRLAGYMYIILASEEQDSVTSPLFGSYMLKLGINLFFLALFGALTIGLLALWLLTRNLRKIIGVVRRFKEGDHQARIPEDSSGDLAPLPETFNDMADTIVANIEQLKSVERLRRELVANISHDLRTPLAIVQGYVETLQMKVDSLSGEERGKYLNIIHQSTENLRKLIEQLFEYSKLEARQIEPDKEPFFLPELAQDILQKYQLLANEKDITLEAGLPADLPLVFADVALVERVFQNLLDNALKFTPPGGRITLSLTATSNSVLVNVADTGPGIPENEQSFLFERYYKRDRTGLKTDGAGLGLAIVKKILELHNATISVRSRMNEGTAFTFNLPAYSG